MRASPKGKRAFEEFVGEHLDLLYRSALRLSGGHEADAEDLLQDATLRAFQRYHQLNDPRAGRAWLMTILTRTHLNLVRSKKRRAETLLTDYDEAAFEEALAGWRPSRSPEDHVVASQLRTEIVAALDTLEPDVRAVVVLSDLEGFTQREVAGMMDVPLGTVASRLFRGRRKLRVILDEPRRDVAGWRNP